nr:RNA-directed DNA polymerase, eukaryota, reverse transcriptase zinc-binding domain protein [Tanacetum cinerariifolium]
MGSQRSKEDEVHKISTLVFVTNFPDQSNAKDLWNACAQYGYVVDAFIPNRRSKAGKRFGFVCFIKVFDVEGLVNNLCKAYWVRAKEIPRWVPDFVEQDNEENDFDDEHSEGELNGDILRSNKDLEGDNEKDVIPDTVFEDNLPKSHDGEASVRQNEVQSEDPFNIYTLLNKKKENNEKISVTHDSLKYPPGFTPKEDVETNVEQSKKRNGSVREDYLCHVIGNWKGEVIVMGDFNEVRNKNERFGSVFNVQGANAFNSFISSAGLEEFPLGVDGFEKLVNETQSESPVDMSNAMLNLMKKLKYLKKKIRAWNNDMRKYSKNSKLTFKAELENLDLIINKGEGVLANGTWIDNPVLVKNEFLSHFKNMFERPKEGRLNLNMEFPYKLTCVQQSDLEIDVSNDGIKRAVWDCGVDKSSGPKGFTFGFYLHFWKLIENDVVAAVKYFFQIGSIPKGCNSSFIALILKIRDAKMVKDFWPISLIGSLYKIIAKILANRLVVVLGDILNEVQSAFVANRQILDGPFILNELFQWCKSKKKHSFILRWCGWIQDCLRSSWGSMIVNGSPTEEFQFFKGLKHGDPLSPFLFILIMESLYISFQRVMDASLFKGIVLDYSMQLSHMFYADDAVFMGQWSDSNINTIVHVLECFHRASGLRINMSKSELMGIVMDVDRVEQATLKISLSKWKMKILSIGGRLTLLKLVLGSIPIYHMSIFKVPMKVLHRMESIRRHLFNGMDLGSKKSIWVKWNNVLASKEKGGLGVSSLYALNRVLMFKWIWWFTTHKSLLWARVIKAIHGDDWKIGRNSKSGHISIWREIVQEMVVFKKQGTDICTFMHKNWEMGRILLSGRMCGEEMWCLNTDLLTTIEGVSLVSMNDRWVWSLECSGNFSVASIRKLIDDRRLLDVSSKTRWIKAVPIKVNVHAWKVRLDSLPTRLNISRRGMDIASIFCHICGNAIESSRHLFFYCHVAKDLFRKISRWRDRVRAEQNTILHANKNPAFRSNPTPREQRHDRRDRVRAEQNTILHANKNPAFRSNPTPREQRRDKRDKVR